MKPLLAHIYEPHRVTFPCYVQPKLNGIRALYQNGRFQSRDELPFPVGLLDHLAKPLKESFAPEVILDGELYVHGWPLQRINAAVTPVRQQPTEDTLQVEYHVFDVVNFDQPFIARLDQRCKIDEGLIRSVATSWVDSQQMADSCYADFVRIGYEGMMYRLGDCPYTVPKQEWSREHCRTLDGANPRARFLSDKNNRCWHLLKRKDWQDDEFTCIGVVEGEGKYKGTTGALLCVTLSGQRFTVGSGLTDAERDHYWQNPPIGRLIKVKYLVLSVDGIPLNPTIIAVL